jgi:homoserine dehydrogenase
MTSTALRVGLAGLGTVGAGTLRLLRENAELIAARAGRPIVPVAVAARDRARDRGVSLDGLAWFDDAVALARDPGVDVVVEVIGGADGVARATVEAALAARKPVVTANKAMLALHGAELAAAAEDASTPLAFEAAVAGGIPAIKALREGLAANRITRVAGILNGTCNYILTTMRDSGRPFADVLAEAQAHGYAEADPAFDIDGIDAAHKLAILVALAFGRPVDFASVHIEGIRHVSALDIAFARELALVIRLVGIAERHDGGISARVHPVMVPAASPLAHVDGVFNAVMVEGDHVGRVMLEGRGAGAGPTASAVVADLIDIARFRHTPPFGMAAQHLSAEPAVPIARRVGAAYLRLMVVDRPGVIADVSAVLRDHVVSLESMIQRGRAPGETVPVVLTTHPCEEAALAAALARIAKLGSVVEPPTMIRIETL